MLKKIYTIIKIQAYALVKCLNHFSVHVRYNKIIAYVPGYLAVKYLLNQLYYLIPRGKLVSKIQEYDLDIQPKRIIKGKGLVGVLNEDNTKAFELGENDQTMLLLIS